MSLIGVLATRNAHQRLILISTSPCGLYTGKTNVVFSAAHAHDEVSQEPDRIIHAPRRFPVIDEAAKTDAL